MLSDRGVAFDLFVSRFNRHLHGIGAGLDISRYDALVPVGGDGTNFHLINGLLSAHPSGDLPPLAILPAGSGNSFARDLGIANMADGIDAIVRNRPRPVDVLEFISDSCRFHFINLTGLGFVTDVARTAARLKRWGDLSYLMGVFSRLRTLSHRDMRLILDGRRYAGPFCFVEFCNSRFTGGAMCMAPRARIDDGLMDVVMAGPLSRSRLLTALPKIFNGTHIHLNEVTVIRAREAIIETCRPCRLLPDGELLGNAPGRIRVHPRKLRYLT